MSGATQRRAPRLSPCGSGDIFARHAEAHVDCVQRVALVVPIYPVSGDGRVAPWERWSAGGVTGALTHLDPFERVSRIAHSTAAAAYLVRHRPDVEHGYSNLARVNPRWLLSALALALALAQALAPALALAQALAPPVARAQLPTAPPRDGRAFRVLEWNVSDSAWVKQRASIRAILRHADPDIVVLVQVAAGIDALAVGEVLSGLRGPGDTTWFVIEQPTGDALEHTVIASRDSVRALPELDGAEVAGTGALAELGAVPDSGRVPARYATPSAVRVAGAVVRVRGVPVVVAAVHLTCCGTVGSWREYRRQAEAAAVRARLAAAVALVRPRGVVIAGDLNLVSGRAAMDTLLATVRAAPLGPMRRAEALHFDGWTDWTWDGRGTPFNGGRLDNVLYSAGMLEARAAWVWDTEALPADTLRAHGLEPGASQAIGRHRPVVVELTMRER